MTENVGPVLHPFKDTKPKNLYKLVLNFVFTVVKNVDGSCCCCCYEQRIVLKIDDVDWLVPSLTHTHTVEGVKTWHKAKAVEHYIDVRLLLLLLLLMLLVINFPTTTRS